MISQKKTNALDGRDCSHIADTLAEGQTSVSFSLVGDGEITADLAGSISASYAGTDPNNSQTAESNTWALSLQDTGEITRTYLGDQRGKLIGIEIDEHITADQPSFNTYKWSATSWTTDGTLNGGVAEADFADVIYAGSGNDKIDGKGGNDALSGGAGNDQIDGGEGVDMIAGGTCATCSNIALGAIYFVAACARKKGIAGISDCKKRRKNTKNLPNRCLAGTSNTQSAHAHSSRLVEHKWLGRRMDSARAVAGLEVG